MRLTGIDELHDNTSCQEVNRVVLKSLERTSTTHKEPPVQLMLFFEQSHSTSWIETAQLRQDEHALQQQRHNKRTEYERSARSQDKRLRLQLLVTNASFIALALSRSINICCRL